MSDDLLLAVKTSDLDQVKALIAAGTDINSTGQFGWTALHLAIYDWKKEIIGWLLQHGADVNIKADDGCTALHYAANYGDRDLVESLINEHGADIHAIDNRGLTPLETGVEMGCSQEIIELLMDSG